MQDHVLKEGQPIALTLRRSARARRISLRVSQLDGRVTLTVPKGLDDTQALDFARSKEGWIRKHLAQMQQTETIRFGLDIPVEGISRSITPAPSRRVLLSDTALAVPGPEETLGRRLSAYLKELARDRLVAASDHYASVLGRSYKRITLRDTRSRWGSCSSKGGLMYSWRLILAPEDVLRYVAAHEVAHLNEMNHSPAFWRTVENIHGPYDTPRQWLRTNGSALHRFRFSD